MCSSLCNDSILQYNPDKDSYEKIGESTEVALRVLAEKVIVSVKSFFSRICYTQQEKSWNITYCFSIDLSDHPFRVILLCTQLRG